MEELEWNEFPENRPPRSGLHVVNREVNNVVKNTLAYYDTGAELWYEDSQEKVPLTGVNAYNNRRILPYLKKNRIT